MFDRKKTGEELISLLKEIHDKQVIVEGKRDKKVLYSLKFKKIITINDGIYETIEKLDEKDILILTDYDPEGKKIARKLNLFLQSHGFKIDRENRRKIGLLFSRLGIRKIEEIRGVLNE